MRTMCVCSMRIVLHTVNACCVCWFLATYVSVKCAMFNIIRPLHIVHCTLDVLNGHMYRMWVVGNQLDHLSYGCVCLHVYRAMNACNNT